MNTKMKSKKGATSISIMLLVVMALILTAVALVYFAKSQRSLENSIYDARIIEQAYSKAESIKFLASQGESPEEIIKLVENSELVGGKPGWFQTGIQSEDMKIRIVHQFEAKK